MRNIIKLLFLPVFLSVSSVSIASLSVPSSVLSVSSLSVSSVSYSVSVSVSVGEPKLTLFGYTSPSAIVNLSGIGVVSQTTADQTGYFYFDRIFLPLPANRWVSETQEELAYPELYLQAVDTENRVSSPVILPTLPIGPYEISVGPILISPTITLEKGSYSPGEQIIASGQTMPNTEVTIYLANDQQKGSFNWFRKIFPFSFFHPSSAYAYFIPKYQIVSDNNGSFEFNLPNNLTKGNISWKVFASSTFLEAPSPKSNSLSFSILSFWQWIWMQIRNAVLGVLAGLQPFLFWLIVSIETLSIAILFYLNARSVMAEKFNGR